MIDGHPWLTKDLDEDRAKQRRWLRDVPDWLIRNVAGDFDPATGVADVDRPMVEAYFRHVANQDDGLQAALAPAGRAAAEVVSTVLRRADSDPFDEMSHVAHEVARDCAVLEKTAEDLGRSRIERWLYLMVWADRLAGDYTDPRLL